MSFTEWMLIVGRTAEIRARRAGLFDLADNQRQWSDAFEAYPYLIPDDDSIPDWFPEECPSASGCLLLGDILTIAAYREGLEG